MAVAAHITCVIEVVQINKLSGDRVIVWSDLLPEIHQAWIAIAPVQVSEDLIVRTILLNQINHVFDAVLQLLNQIRFSPVQFSGEPVATIHCYLW